MPMESKVFRTAEGSIVIACSRTKRKDCSVCTQRRGDLLCDFVKPNGKTCDAPLCRDCAKRVGPNKDFCPTHPKPVAP